MKMDKRTYCEAITQDTNVWCKLGATSMFAGNTLHRMCRTLRPTSPSGYYTEGEANTLILGVMLTEAFA